MPIFVQLLWSGVAHAQGGFTADDVTARLKTASPRASCIVRYETGGTYDPNLIGKQGELGAAQLHPRGKLPAFYARGYSDPRDPVQAIEFLEEQIHIGQAGAWSPVARGLC